MKTESKSITVKDFKEYIKDISDETRVLIRTSLEQMNRIMLNNILNTPCSLQCSGCIFTNICMPKTLKIIKSNLEE